MNMGGYKQILLTTALIIGSLQGIIAQKNKQAALEKSIPANGQTDRAFWVKTLYKIAYPVVHNLAQGTLKKNMPLEQGADYNLVIKDVTYLEAVGRTAAGIAPWLALPDDKTEEGLLRSEMRKEMLQGLKNAADPQNPDYLNFEKQAQPIVDAAYLAHAFLRAPKALWEPLDTTTKQRYIHAFKSLRNRNGAYNNWLVFAGLTEGFLRYIGEDYDPARIDFALNKMKEWYAGDSWYKDGDLFSMDYYNSYVIHPMLTDLVRILQEKRPGKMHVTAADYDLVLRRMIRHAEFLERIIAPDGTYPAFGRSVTYRTAAFQVLGQVALMEKLPGSIKPAQVRCALTRVFHNMFDGNQNFDASGWLVLGFNGHQPMMADVYTSTGSLYMATLGFLPLGLPAGNSFWTDAPADWTSKKAWGGQPVKKDYKVEY